MVLRAEFTVMEAKLNARKTFPMNESAWGLGIVTCASCFCRVARRKAVWQPRLL